MCPARTNELPGGNQRLRHRQSKGNITIETESRYGRDNISTRDFSELLDDEEMCPAQNQRLRHRRSNGNIPIEPE
eukprot:5735047-Ditylum_brightwellii.AAC.1